MCEPRPSESDRVSSGARLSLAAQHTLRARVRAWCAPGAATVQCIAVAAARVGNTDNTGWGWRVLGILRIIFYYYNTDIKYC